MIASNGIWVIPGKEAIIGREGMSHLAIWFTDIKKLKV